MGPWVRILRIWYEAPNKVWVGDITYVWTAEGWLYLASVIDLFSRQVVGFAMGERMGARLVVDALRMAWFRRRPASGLIFHSDRGSQYASAAFTKQIRAFAMRASMSGKGDCWDNAVAESLFGSLKTESLHRHDFGKGRVGRVTKSWREPQDTIPRACTPPWAISAPWPTKRNGLPESSQKPHSSIPLSWRLWACPGRDQPDAFLMLRPLSMADTQGQNTARKRRIIPTGDLFAPYPPA